LNQGDDKQPLHSRRSALKRLCTGVFLASGIDQLFAKSALARKDPYIGSYDVLGWTGDDFTLGHRLRDKNFEVKSGEVEKTHDCVIIGGGIAGLALAHYLKEADYLLLEQYNELGGQARGELTGSLGFSYGSTWVSKREGPVGQLFDELKLDTQNLKPVTTSWLWNHQWIPYPNEMEDFALTECLSHLIENARHQFITIPPTFAFPQLGVDSLAELDKFSFEKTFPVEDEQFRRLLDSYFRSVACCNTSTISTLAGLTLIRSLTNERVAFPAGNVNFAEALEKDVQSHHPDGCRTNAFVWSVELQDSQVLVTYSDANDQFHTVAGKHVVITAPPMVASRLVKNLSNAARVPLLKFRYGSYLVGNICLAEPIPDLSYQNYTNFSSGLSEINAIELDSKEQESSRLTLKQPFEPGSEGRTLLLEGDKQLLAASLIDQLRKCVGSDKLEAESITLSRWGHAIAAPLPGYYTIASEINANQPANLSFAHCSTAGIASLEAAVCAALGTAKRVLGKS
jgi:protoporphyrinogen oxidase